MYLGYGIVTFAPSYEGGEPHSVGYYGLDDRDAFGEYTMFEIAPFVIMNDEQFKTERFEIKESGGYDFVFDRTKFNEQFPDFVTWYKWMIQSPYTYEGYDWWNFNFTDEDGEEIRFCSNGAVSKSVPYSEDLSVHFKELADRIEKACIEFVKKNPDKAAATGIPKPLDLDPIDYNGKAKI